MKVNAYRFLMNGPSDVSGLKKAIDSGEISPQEVVCIIGKTEGNGGRNDFTRELTTTVFENLFASYLNISPEQVQNKVIFSLSGGTEGVVSPHVIVFTSKGKLLTSPKKQKRLVVGTTYTRVFVPSEIGCMAQIEETAHVIKKLLEDLRLDPADVHLIQMKGAIPSYTYDEEVAAQKAGKPLRSNMIYSRSASALGAALALGEVDPEHLSDNVVCQDWSLYSGVASTSAKPGLLRTEIMVFGNSLYASGDLEIGHVVLQDMLDTPSIKKLLTQLGMAFDVQLSDGQRKQLVGVFAKSEADSRGTIRGQRHTMLTDDDINDTRYSRCVLSSVIAGMLGDCAIYVSTRAEHHGPQGGGSLSMIIRHKES